MNRCNKRSIFQRWKEETKHPTVHFISWRTCKGWDLEVPYYSSTLWWKRVQTHWYSDKKMPDSALPRKSCGSWSEVWREFFFPTWTSWHPPLSLQLEKLSVVPKEKSFWSKHRKLICSILPLLPGQIVLFVTNSSSFITFWFHYMKQDFAWQHTLLCSSEMNNMPIAYPSYTCFFQVGWCHMSYKDGWTHVHFA